ncbi:MAG: HlyD family secretion protein [Candidatus Eremiobacteraeota bacterium]|nr:HlyD family secretion protein [Candidatus Eremiobacteraeota bacterium]MBV8460162.1 HlyD family secretion protein [Candidatus Eremiobacteraeota bacterium]MBV8596443.1 HlyD family secretion protein [Candidatus Eremiobacteraeota bacterium]MBV8667590.1 HlyD family secretion protein [Candidatus Eremiobacteraeota bacterium]
MSIIVIVTVGYLTFCWLVFKKFRWLKFTPGWVVVSAVIGLHLVLGLLIGLRFGTPYSGNAKVVQYTIQLIPRLPEPTLVTAVLVENNQHVKKGQVLFQFDRRPYEYQVKRLEAQLNADLAKTSASQFNVRKLQVQLTDANRDVGMYKADLGAARQKVIQNESDLRYAKFQEVHFKRLVARGAAPEENYQKWAAQVLSLEAQIKAAQADEDRAYLTYSTQSGGVNTVVAAAQAQLRQGEADYVDATAAVKNVQAQLQLARYYLDNTTYVAPADGRIINLQVRPGMVSGIVRVGGIASFIVDTGRYMLASYYQPELKFVKPGQPVEVAIDLYPGQIFQAKVDSVWYASGEGQYLPSDVLPTFNPAPTTAQFETKFAVKILIDQSLYPRYEFPIGAQGVAAIYTTENIWAVLRKIDIRCETWLEWLFPPLAQ